MIRVKFPLFTEADINDVADHLKKEKHVVRFDSNTITFLLRYINGPMPELLPLPEREPEEDTHYAPLSPIINDSYLDAFDVR
jgi:hypothetical protein